jgi:purine-binding chemotaxis protein CheW
MSGTDTERLVTFRVAGELYAVDVACVERVIRYVPARAVPQLPSWLDGVIEHDGRIVPVVDLRRRLSDQHAPLGAKARMLLVRVGDERCAAVVDQVLDVRAYDEASRTAAPSLVRGRAGGFVRGVVTREGALVLILDVVGLLSGDERDTLLAVESLNG